MSAHAVACSRCRTPLPPGLLKTSGMVNCPFCEVLLQADIFPALFRAAGPGSAGERILTDTEAGCFYHPQKKAVVPCDSCGRFLCALCDVEFEGRHLCPACLESGEKKGRLKNLEKSILLMDDVALAVAILPLLVWPLTILTAPTTVFLCIRHWNSKLSILPRWSKFRFLLALIFSGLQIFGWAALFYILLTRK